MKKQNRTTPAKTKAAAGRPKWLLPAALVVVAVVVVGGIAAVIANQQPPYVPEVTDRPAVQLSQDRFDYGTVSYSQVVNTSFQVKNVGDETLYVLGEPQIEVVEGCCPPKTQISSKTLHPGEEATVSFSFQMHEGMDGPHDFRVHVLTTDPVNPDKTVQVLSNWVP